MKTIYDGSGYVSCAESLQGMARQATAERWLLLGCFSQVTIVVAVSHPRQEIWQLFSHAVLLRSGSVVYCGAAHHALEGLARFGQLFGAVSPKET